LKRTIKDPLVFSVGLAQASLNAGGEEVYQVDVFIGNYGTNLKLSRNGPHGNAEHATLARIGYATGCTTGQGVKEGSMKGVYPSQGVREVEGGLG